MYALQIENLTKIYANGVHALKNISLTVEAGDFFALIGPNGAGKSTTIGIVTSLVNKTSGSVKIFNYDLDKQINQAKFCIGCVPQEFNFSILHTPWDILIRQAGYYGIKPVIAKERATKYLKALDLWHKRFALGRMLSGGQKRRLMIARALIHEPPLLILDEPTAGVDIELRRNLWNLMREINEQGTTIILTTHYLEEAEQLCRKVAIINHGNIIENGEMNKVLMKLQGETLVLYLFSACEETPNVDGFSVRMLDQRTIEVDILPEQTINQLFYELSKQNIIVTSMRNKVNRLEELFLRLTKT